MRRQIVIRPEAEADLVDACRWYDDCQPGLAAELLLAVEACLEAIGEGPESFPVIHRTIRRALVRRFPYCVFYVVDADRAVVLAILHASRDPKRWHDRS